ncbi:peptide deformylase [Lederbergia graminis]|uniref:Peptide deformylase n=1 Tax=Lederbergia graminis TaxID=735518 RepID=A0ABW0LDC7_9BACI|nr:peptide deformylase [Bacillaceae bacterium]
MAILSIVTHPADILEVVCDPVTEFNHELHILLDDMYETMVAADGVGLAAPQIGIKKRIAVIDVGDKNGIIELINPTIIKAKGENTDIEGCLSFPNLYGTVSRAQIVKIKAQDRNGKEFKLKANDYLARAIQHELDHLDGVLFTTKVIEYVDEEDLESSEV